MSTLSALREECAQVSAALGQIEDAEFEGPTRCSEWSVKELLAHMYRDIDNIAIYLAHPEPDLATHDSITCWRDVPRMAAGIADRAKGSAATFATAAALVDAWNALWPAVLDQVQAADPERLVTTWGPSMTLEEYLRTRVLEIVVHHMDLEDAFGRTCWGTDEAVGIVDEMLVDILGREPAHELDWDVIEFIERATGRKDLTAHERTLLGVRAAKRFPLIV
jgi:uncharacterized protein (TIGR03083 family)